MSQCLTRSAVLTTNVEIEHALDERVAYVADRARCRVDTGVVDENVERTTSRRHVDGFDQLLRLGDVANGERRGSTGAHERIGSCLPSRVEIGNRDVRAGLRESVGDRRADALRAARHQCAPTGEIDECFKVGHRAHPQDTMSCQVGVARRVETDDHRAVPAMPQSIDAITPQFLTDALATASDGGIVTGVRADDIGTGVGVFGLIARLHLTWEGAAPSAPTTVVAKMPTSAEANRNVGLALGLYEREHRFYAEVASDVPLRVPVCHVNHGDAATGRYLLVLEDLSAMEPGDQLAGLNAARASAIVSRLAAHHALWWESTRLDELRWLPAQDDPLYLAAVPPIVSAGIAALAAFESSLPSGSMELARRVDAGFVELTHACAAGPHTFVHGDARLDNLFFERGTDDCAVIDWQLSLRCRGVADVVWLLATSMDPEIQNTAVEGVLADYRRFLSAHGVSVTERDLRRSAAEHAGYLLSGPLSLIGTFDYAGVGDGRAQELTKKWVARGFNLALLLGTADVV